MGVDATLPATKRLRHISAARWFGGKGSGLASVRVAHEERLPGDIDVRHTLVEVRGEHGATDLYQLLLGYSALRAGLTFLVTALHRGGPG